MGGKSFYYADSDVGTPNDLERGSLFVELPVPQKNLKAIQARHHPHL